MLHHLARWQKIVVVGILAGSIATFVQLLLWWATSVPLPETLYRDTRLTAAIVMSEDIITPAQLMQAPSALMLFLASAIHFSLSLAYAGTYAWLPWRQRRVWLTCVSGAVFGLLIYVVNMYGFTLVFPWFAMVRDGYTIAAHIVFGLVIALGVRASE